MSPLSCRHGERAAHLHTAELGQPVNTAVQTWLERERERPPFIADGTGSYACGLVPELPS